MIAKGIENVDSTIEACRMTLASLESSHSEWKEILQSVMEIMGNLKINFFLKTNLAIPVTNACLKDASELKTLVEKRNLSTFPEVLSRFQSNIEKLLKQAKMEGVIIT